MLTLWIGTESGQNDQTRLSNAQAKSDMKDRIINLAALAQSQFFDLAPREPLGYEIDMHCCLYCSHECHVHGPWDHPDPKLICVLPFETECPECKEE
ncbi:MAG: hypothetical protein Q8P12_02655 [bacterium]|nr:hypothetical protein [bacterium]MDZ4345148.1 hypothetical protein [Candidatus Binatia bacterium]